MFLDFSLEGDELAGKLGGGIPTGSLVLIEGISGAGKSVLAQRLTYGLLNHRNRVVYVSTEFTTPAFLTQMSQLGYPVSEPFSKRELMFVPTNPLLGHVVPRHEWLPRLMAARALLRQPVVVVDDFSNIIEPHLEAGRRGSQVIEHLVRSLKQINATGTTLILTMDPSNLENVDTSALTSGADVRLECRVERTGGIVDRFVIPRKFARARAMVGDVIPFRVEPGAGFIVEIKAVS